MEIKILSSLQDMAPSDWSQLLHGSFPFSSYEYLRAMEEGGCVGPGTGWTPRYLTLWQDGKLLAATYLYLKDNSNGEFIFDWDWASAYERHGLPYYPKLVSAVPFTPATGPKLLRRAEADSQVVFPRLIQALLAEGRRVGASGAHFLFILPEEIPFLEREGFMIRHTHQYHWRNASYASFEDFLKVLKRKRRLQIKRERRQVQALPVEIVSLAGEQILPEHIQAMYEFYLDTHERRGGIPYLTQEFFERVYQTMREKLLLVMARAEGRWVAGSINYHQGDCLYGRYWGCRQDFKNLHFEICFYRTIEYAIQNKIRLFEAGAQGTHKIYRGLEPEIVYSAHFIEHLGFRRAIAEAIEREKRGLEQGLEDFRGAGHGAYRRSNSP